MYHDFRRQKRVHFVLSECNNNAQVPVTILLPAVEVDIEEIKLKPSNPQM